MTFGLLFNIGSVGSCRVRGFDFLISSFTWLVPGPGKLFPWEGFYPPSLSHMLRADPVKGGFSDPSSSGTCVTVTEGKTRWAESRCQKLLGCRALAVVNVGTWVFEVRHSHEFLCISIVNCRDGDLQLCLTV